MRWRNYGNEFDNRGTEIVHDGTYLHVSGSTVGDFGGGQSAGFSDAFVATIGFRRPDKLATVKPPLTPLSRFGYWSPLPAPKGIEPERQPPIFEVVISFTLLAYHNGNAGVDWSSAVALCAVWPRVMVGESRKAVSETPE